MSTKEKFVRWNGHARDQLTLVMGLLLTLGVAGLAYHSTWILNDDVLAVSRPHLASFLLLGLSSACGITALLTRLYDFRLTATLARAEGNRGINQSVVETKRNASRLGKATWNLFWAQLVFFVFGTVWFGLHIVKIALTKLV